MTDGKPIDFYFDFISPFGWIAAERVGDMARERGRAINWRPFLLKATVVDAMGLPPVVTTPLKGPYLVHDAARHARFHGLQLSDKVGGVFSSVAPARAVIWARRHAPELVEPLVLALYRRWMRDGEDIASPQAVIEVAAAVGIDPAALAEGLGDPEIKDALKRDVEDTIAAGVFGSPTLVVDGEMFWGSDRVDQAFAWIDRGGW